MEAKPKLDRLWASLEHSSGAFGSASRLRDEARKLRIPDAQVEEYLRNTPSYYVHAPARLRFPRKHTFAAQLHSHHQADLGDFSSLSAHNDGLKWLLLIVDVYSRQLFVRALPNKRPGSVADALREIYRDFQPFYLCHDRGMEFWGKPVVDLCKELEIKQFSLDSGLKASMAERYIRTVKQRIYRYFTHNNTRNWVRVVEQIAANLNNTFSPVIRMRPADVTFETVIPAPATRIVKNPRFAVGDTVVISRARGVFSKSYVGNWTREFFVVRSVNDRYPTTYRIVDLNGEPVLGAFYDAELQRAENQENVYKVETVLAKRKRKGKTEYLVKWLDYPETFNSWIDAADLMPLNAGVSL